MMLNRVLFAIAVSLMLPCGAVVQPILLRMHFDI